MLFDVFTLFALFVLNGALAMSELAVTNARTSRLQALAGAGSKGAATALRLAANPGMLLSTVQIGITLVGILSGALSGATLGARATDALLAFGVPAQWAGTLGVGGVVVLVTYASIVVGELVPKRLALRAPETVAVRMAPILSVVAKVTAPFVWLLDVSGRLILALLGQSKPVDRSVDEGDLEAMLNDALEAGVLDAGETDLIAGVMRVADRTARGLMVPRRDVETVSIHMGLNAIAQRFRDSRCTRLVVLGGTPDDVLGVIHVRDFVELTGDATSDASLRRILLAIPSVTDGMVAMDVVGALRSSPSHMVAVIDEHGHFDGIITPMDLLEGIAGDFPEHTDSERAITERADGSLIVAGWMPADAFVLHLGLDTELAADRDTAAGVVLDAFGRLPAVGDTTTVGGWTIEVVDMDGRRLDGFLATRTT
jgi:putative hemolysin